MESLLPKATFDRLRAMAEPYKPRPRFEVERYQRNRNETLIKEFRGHPDTFYSLGLAKRIVWSRKEELRQLNMAVEQPILCTGWPDAGPVEMKIGADWIRANQWVRFAWIKKYKAVDIMILRTPTQEDAVMGVSEIYTIPDYIQARYDDRAEEMTQLWNRLIEVVPEKETNVRKED